MTTRWLLVPTALVIMAGCGSGATVDVAAARESLREAAQAYQDVVNGGDLEQFSALYAESGVMMPPNQQSISGESGIQAYAERFRAIENFSAEMALGAVEVSPDGQWGYTVARVRVTGMSDGQPVGETLRDVHLWVRDAIGEWKIAVDVWNALDPAEGMD